MHRQSMHTLAWRRFSKESLLAAQKANCQARLRISRQRNGPARNSFAQRVRDSRSTKMQAQIKFGRIAGISIGLHYSWFIIAALITLSLAGHFHSVAPE